MRRGRLWLIVAVLGSAAACWVFSDQILRASGALMIAGENPVPADVIVVLAGDSQGRRIMRGAELAREGFAPLVLVNNGGFDYSHSESDLAKEFAIQHGYSPDLFLAATWIATSTVEEAQYAIAQMRQRGVHRALVVTTLWHTARAGRIYRRLAPDIEFHLVNVSDPNWAGGNWWLKREGKKSFFMEACKTVADFLRI